MVAYVLNKHAKINYELTCQKRLLNLLPSRLSEVDSDQIKILLSLRNITQCKNYPIYSNWSNQKLTICCLNFKQILTSTLQQRKAQIIMKKSETSLPNMWQNLKINVYAYSGTGTMKTFLCNKRFILINSNLNSTDHCNILRLTINVTVIYIRAVWFFTF